MKFVDKIKQGVKEWKDTEVPVVVKGEILGWAKSRAEYKRIEKQGK